MSHRLFSVAILAGGLATRLRPLAEKIPKALIDINGEPFLAHQLRLLHAQDIKRVVLCVGYLGDQIVQVIGDGSQFGVQVAYSFDGPTLLGTAGAIEQALPQLDESFFVLYGDSYLTCNYRSVQAAFERCGKNVLMTVYRNEGQWDTSNVEFDHGRILAYSKKKPTPRMRHIDYGLGVFKQTAFAGLQAQCKHDLESVYQDLLQQEQLAAFEVSERFYEVGSLAGLEEIRRHLAERVEGSNQR